MSRSTRQEKTAQTMAAIESTSPPASQVAPTVTPQESPEETEIEAFKKLADSLTEVDEPLGGLPHAKFRGHCKKCGWESLKPTAEEARDMVTLHIARRHPYGR